MSIMLLAFSIIVFLFFILIPWLRADRSFVNSRYHGVIEGIEYRNGNRGVPHILVDNQWRLLRMGELKIESHIVIGDSLSKEKGRRIEIYSKKDGTYQLKGIY